MSDDIDEDVERARWSEAFRREEAFRQRLSRYPKGLNGQVVADLAWELGLNRAT